MKIQRLLLIVTILAMSVIPVTAQKTILFLLPLGAEKTAQANIENINSQQDIDEFFGRSLIHFWEGAQIAITELGDEGNDLHVVVRDVTDMAKLERVLEEPTTDKADLIIAPLYGKLFPTVAEFGHKHKIPVVNPFTSRHDVIEGNPYVYKASPALASRAAYVCNHHPNANIILWADTAKGTPDAEAYQAYFREHHIAFHIVADSNFFGPQLSHTKDNVVITCFHNEQLVNKGMTQTLQANKLPSFTWIIPEEWLLMEDFNIDNMNGLNINYFANYFVDKSDEHTQVFNYKYGERFHCLPSVHNYAYQGYDLTKFFIKLILNDYRIPDTQNIAYDFQFKRIEKGGFENVKARFIHLQNYEFKEVK